MIQYTQISNFSFETSGYIRFNPLETVHTLIKQDEYHSYQQKKIEEKNGRLEKCKYDFSIYIAQ